MKTKELFQFVSPQDLKTTITNIVMENLIFKSEKKETMNKEDLENISLLLRFLDERRKK